MNICFDVTTTQILIFILFVNTGTLFESDFSLCVSLILSLEIFGLFSTISAKLLFYFALHIINFVNFFIMLLQYNKVGTRFALLF